MDEKKEGVTSDADTREAEEQQNAPEKNEEKQINQEEIDKIVSERLAREKSKHQKELEQAIQQAVDEERRLSKLSLEEKEKELARKQAEELSTREKELAVRANRLDAIERMNELKIPTHFVDFVVSEDADDMNEKIDKLAKAYQESVNLEVAERLKGEAPKNPTAEEPKPYRKLENPQVF